METELRTLLAALKTEYANLDPDSDRARALDIQVRRLDAYLWQEQTTRHMDRIRLVAARKDMVFGKTPRY